MAQRQSTIDDYAPLTKALAVVGIVSIVVGIIAAFVTGNLISAFIGGNLLAFGLVELFFVAGGALFIAVALASSRDDHLSKMILYVLLGIVVVIALIVLFALEIA